MPGNFLGARRYYKYTTDTGEEFKYQTDANLGEAVAAIQDDTLPDLPRRFYPRYVLCEDDDGNKKKVICPGLGTAPYLADHTTVVTIEGVSFKTTGRVGEKRTFGRNPSAAGGGGGAG